MRTSSPWHRSMVSGLKGRNQVHSRHLAAALVRASMVSGRKGRNQLSTATVMGPP